MTRHAWHTLSGHRPLPQPQTSRRCGKGSLQFTFQNLNPEMRYLIDAEVQHTPVLRRLHVEPHDVPGGHHLGARLPLHHETPEDGRVWACRPPRRGLRLRVRDALEAQAPVQLRVALLQPVPELLAQPSVTCGCASGF